MKNYSCSVLFSLCSLVAAPLAQAAGSYHLLKEIPVGGDGGWGCASEKNEEANEAKLQAQAKVSRADAEKTALTKAPGGTIKDGELEKEGGKLIWSFDIATPGTRNITEVQVNALTGEIVSVENETPADQKKEKENDEKEKREKKK